MFGLYGLYIYIYIYVLLIHICIYMHAHYVYLNVAIWVAQKGVAIGLVFVPSRGF